MWRNIKRIIFIIITFIGFLFFATYIWCILEKTALNNVNASNLNFTEFLLYILGYGDIENANFTLKLIYSIIGIMALALLSSVFTVSLFEWRKRLIISKNLIVWDNKASEHFGSILIRNKYRDIYKLTLTMHLDTGSNTFFEERFFPFVSKNSEQVIDYKIEAGSVIYKYLRNVLKFGYNSTLALIASYVDSSNGQEYILCNKYQLANNKHNNRIIINNASISSKTNLKKFKNMALRVDNMFDDYIVKEIISDGFSIDLQKAIPVRNENIKINYEVAPVTRRDILNLSVASNPSVITSNINFKDEKGSDPENFGMALIKKPLGGDWQKYYELNCSLAFDIYVSVGIIVSLEIKNSDGLKIIEPAPKFKSNDCYESYSYDLKNLPSENWKDVDEMCFTVFQKDTKINKGDFSIMGCELVSMSENCDKKIKIT